MPKVVFIAHDGQRSEVEVPLELSLMRAATDNNVRGIDGDCGGVCACATCHVFIDPEWAGRVGPRTAQEEEMLNFAAGVQDNSRLACQISMRAELDGVVLHLPEGQH
jgi:2Fe-2S ferredoxin